MYGPKGIILYKPKRAEEKKEERKEKEEQRKVKSRKELINELEKLITINGMAYIPENIYRSVENCVLRLFDESLDNIIEMHEQEINNRFKNKIYFA